MATAKPRRIGHKVVFSGEPKGVPGYYFHIESCPDQEDRLHVDASFGDIIIYFNYSFSPSETQDETFSNIMKNAKRLFIDASMAQKSLEEAEGHHVN